MRRRSRWQREALNNTDAGRAANDRLDTAMRLFDYASGSAASRDLPEFFAQVRAMRIEADSLAKVAPHRRGRDADHAGGLLGETLAVGVDSGHPARHMAEPGSPKHDVRW